MKFTYALSLLSALSTSVTGADIWGNRVTAVLAADSSDDEFDQICLKEWQAVNNCFIDAEVSDDEVEIAREDFDLCIDDILAAPLADLLPSDLCSYTCGAFNYCIAETTGAITASPPCNAVLSTEANCEATYFVKIDQGKEIDSCQCSSPPAAPSTSLGLVASVLKKNLRA